MKGLETSPPGASVFNRNMIAAIPLVASLQVVNKRKHQLVDGALMKENAKRIQHNYKIGDNVMMASYDPKKLDPKLHSRL